MTSLLPAFVVRTTFRAATLSWLFLQGIPAFGTRAFQTSVPGSRVVIVGVAYPVVLHLEVARERTWSGNLGVSRRRVALFALGLPVWLELAAGFFLRALGGSG